LAGMPADECDVSFLGKTGHGKRGASIPVLMLWTAPTLRHRSAI